MIRIVNSVTANEDTPIRLSLFLRDRFPQLPSHKSVKKAIEKNTILVNGVPGNTGDWVKVGDIISLTHFNMPDAKEQSQKAVPRVGVLYEDEYLGIVVKPAGLATSGSKNRDLAKFLPFFLDASNQIDALPNPLPIHRLDRDTEGLMVVGKTWSAMDRLGAMLADHQISKYYIAIGEGLFHGKPNVIDTPVDNLNAQTEIVSYHHLPTKDPTTLFKLALRTGRTHQIRIHLKSIGHPIVGDNKYNKEGISFKIGLLLVAAKLEFHHPFIDKTVNVEWKESKKFRKYYEYIAF